MSVAVDVVPVVHIPERARVHELRAQPVAPVLRLHPCSDPAPLRLTRRGVVVLAIAVAALAWGLLALAAASAPVAPAPGPKPVSVTVAPGETLWSIAARVAPERDPRAEVVALERANHLAGPTIVPGQVLRVP